MLRGIIKHFVRDQTLILSALVRIYINVRQESNGLRFIVHEKYDPTKHPNNITFIIAI